MKLATHNTMTYQKPKQWWAKLFPFVARCQRVDYKKQHELGAQGFDLRIFWDKKGNIEFRHGIYRYPADNLYEVLDYARDNNIIVRVLFELRNYNMKSVKNVDKLIEMFINFCENVEKKYPTIQFYGGRCTGTWEQIYKFRDDASIKEIALYSSVTSLFSSDNKLLRVIDDLFPWFYARIRNKKNIDENKSNNDIFLSVDFIDIQ